MHLDHAWIARHLPHHGTMCLLHAVTAWDAGRIECTACSHRDVHNPLRAHGRLGIACGIEYAAQTMALHGALVAGAADGAGDSARPAAGFLASVRGVRLHALRLDDVADDLLCHAVRIAGDAAGAMYEFEVRSAARCLIDGRATVVLDAGERIKP